MAKARKDIMLYARGKHLESIQKNGLKVETTWKGYSLGYTVPFIKRIAHKNTVVIPILNIYGTGGKLQKMLPKLLVTDGCIYVSAIKYTDSIRQNSYRFAYESVDGVPNGLFNEILFNFGTFFYNNQK